MFVKSTASGRVDNLQIELENCGLYIYTKANYDKGGWLPDKSRQILSRPVMPILPLDGGLLDHLIITQRPSCIGPSNHLMIIQGILHVRIMGLSTCN